jgi:hypothetical protein
MKLRNRSVSQVPVLISLTLVGNLSKQMRLERRRLDFFRRSIKVCPPRIISMDFPEDQSK